MEAAENIRRAPWRMTGRPPIVDTTERMRPILVTGATGRVGRHVVDHLLAAGESVRALTRQPATAQLPPGVDAMGGDLTVPDSLDAALCEVETVFLVWTAPPATVPAVIERLAKCARRVVLLSSPHQTPHPFFQQPNPLARFHADIERRINASRLGVTIIRPGMFASNTALWWGPMMRAGDVVRWPYGDAETAPIDERDVAAVAARALRDDVHVGRDYVLTGSESLSQVEQVASIGEAIGRTIRFEELSPDEFRRETAGTWPPAAVDMLMAAWQATIGHRAYVTSTVRDVIGSPPRTFHQWAANNAAAFSIV
jgi:uncharacterized protein YbjT (DUF2867 family)